MNTNAKVSLSRSRAGCAQCKRVSRKCDEKKPACGRCARLFFSCDYRPRLLWKMVENRSAQAAPLRLVKSTERDNRQTGQGAAHFKMACALSLTERILSEQRWSFPYRSAPTAGCLAPKVSDWKHIIDPNSMDFRLLNDFVAQGQLLLHYSGMSDNPIISEILPRCHSSATVLAAVISFQACQLGGLESFAKFDTAMRLCRKMPPAEDVSCLLVTGMLICHASMYLGYGWTQQIAGLLSLATSCGYVKSNDQIAIQVIEGLAIMDLDVWMMRRRTNPSHIWSKYCLGRTGVEPFTALPRSLLDLIATAVLHGDNAEDIRAWAAGLDSNVVSAAQYHSWKASALATILYMHLKGTAVSDYRELANMVRTHIDRFLEIISSEPWQNPRQVIWPLYTVGQLATDSQTRRYVIQVLDEQVTHHNQPERNRFKLALEEIWTKKDADESGIVDVVIGERQIEWGIW